MKNEQEAIDIINERAKPLAAYVFTSKKEVKELMVASISSGGMVVNDTVLHVRSQSQLLIPKPLDYLEQGCVCDIHCRVMFDYSHEFFHRWIIDYSKTCFLMI